jgi:hypothetical protein
LGEVVRDYIPLEKFDLAPQHIPALNKPVTRKIRISYTQHNAHDLFFCCELLLAIYVPHCIATRKISCHQILVRLEEATHSLERTIPPLALDELTLSHLCLAIASDRYRQDNLIL